MRHYFNITLTVLAILSLFACSKAPVEAEAKQDKKRGAVGDVYGNQNSEPTLIRTSVFNDAITPDGRIGLAMKLFKADGTPVEGKEIPASATIEARPMPINDVVTSKNGSQSFNFDPAGIVDMQNMNGNKLVLGSGVIDNGLNIQMAISGNPGNQRLGIPSPCRLGGSETFNGECYRLMLFAPLKPPANSNAKSQWVVRAVPLEIDVIAFNSNGKRRVLPRILRAQIMGHFTPLRTKTGGWVEGAELSVTADGRMLFATGTYYNDSGDFSSAKWTGPIDLFQLHAQTANVSIQGIPFHRRYPLAAAPITDLMGKSCDEELCRFDYPWVSQDGADLFFNQSADDNGPLRASFTMVGARTRHKMIVVDGPQNTERLSGPGRLQSLGLYPSMWSQFSELEPTTGVLPQHKGEPIYMMLGRSGKRGYAEVTMRELLDDNYLLYLRMNEYVRPRNSKNENELPLDSEGLPFNPRISKKITVDTSGKALHGTLEGPAFFPQEAHRIHAVLPQNEFGFAGKSVYFRDSGFIRVPTTSQVSGQTPFTAPLSAGTWQVAIQLKQWPTRNTPIAGQGGVWRMAVSPNGTLSFFGQVTKANGQAVSFTGPTGLKISALNQWHHVAFTLGRTETDSIVRGYVHSNGVEQTGEATIPQGKLVFTGQQIHIGPEASGGTLAGGVLYQLDEFGFSNVSRPINHIRRAARFQGDTASLLVGLGRPFTSPQDPAVSVTLSESDLPASIAGLLDSKNPDSFYDRRDLHIPKPIAYYVFKKGKFSPVRGLGEALFEDTQLTGKNISCQSCHSSAKAFADPSSGSSAPATSTGVTGPLRRNTPTMANRIFSVRQFLDGRSPNMVAQAWGPILNPDEMAGVEATVIQYVRTAPKYGPLFQALGYSSRSTMTPEAIKHWVAIALATFELDQILQPGLADKIERRQSLNGQDPEIASALRGRNLFFGKARCTNCHSGGNFTDEQIHNNGSFSGAGHTIASCGDTLDCGRFEKSRLVKEIGAFKTPTLRGIRKTAPYFHGGTVRTLREVVMHYNNAQVTNTSGPVSPLIQPLGLSNGDVDDLTEYLQSL